MDGRSITGQMLQKLEKTAGKAERKILTEPEVRGEKVHFFCFSTQ